MTSTTSASPIAAAAIPVEYSMSAAQAEREGADQLVSGRYLEPEEIADAIVFLCSDAARGLQGAVLNVNGGNWMP